ncbi:glycosyl transferase, partial [Leucobacter sp. M11]|uniref:glycosyl transferase n=1 Tax=Leucobacter sp. M11 TaxID=2993565 RepID=UPI002D7E89CD
MRTGHRQSRAAQLHRRLVYAPAVVAPLHWLSLPFIAVFRLIWSLIREQPGRMIGEVRAALGTFFRPGNTIRSRRRIAANNTAGWAAVRPLRVDPKAVRTRRMIDREAILAKQGRTSSELHFISTGGLAVLLSVFVIALGLHWWLFGAGSVSGGAIAPLGQSLGDLWSHTRSSGSGPADPYAWVLAVLGTLTFWAPSLSVVLLVAAAMPLAALAAWVLAAQFTQSGLARATAAITWAASPVLLSALDSGRLPTILLGVLLPWLLLGALRTRSSWSWAGLTSLLAAAVLAVAPVLLPAAIVLWLVGIVSAPRGQARVISTAIAPAALFAPLAWVAFTRGSPLSLLADPGPILPFTAGTERHLAIGFPEFGLHSWEAVLDALGLSAVPTTLAVGILLAPLAILALLGLYVTRVRLTLFAGLTAGLGLVTALVSPSLQLVTIGGEPMGVWPGSGLALYWLGLLMLAASGLTALGRGKTPVAVLTIVGALLAVLPLLVSTVTGQGAIRPDAQSLPAVVRAAAAADPSVGTLVIAAESESGVRATVERGEGTELGALRTSRFLGEPSAAEQGIAELTGVLVSTGDPRAAELLATQDIEFVLLTPGGNRATVAELQAAFDQNSALAPVGETASGDLWRISAQALADGAEVAPLPEATASPFATPIQLGQIALLLALVLLALPTGEVVDRPEKRPSRRAQQRARLAELRAIERTEAERLAAEAERERAAEKEAEKAARKAKKVAGRRQKRDAAAAAAAPAATDAESGAESDAAAATAEGAAGTDAV